MSNDLNVTTLPVAKLKLDPKNARKHNARSVSSLKSSLTKFGQRKPVVVQKEKGRKTSYVVRAGNGLVTAAKALGWESVAATVFDEDDTTAMAYAIADNRTAEISEWDYEHLTELLRELESQGVDLEELGWEQHELDPLFAGEWDAPKLDDDLGQYETDGGGNVAFSEDDLLKIDSLCDALGGATRRDAIMDAISQAIPRTSPLGQA